MSVDKTRWFDVHLAGSSIVWLKQPCPYEQGEYTREYSYRHYTGDLALTIDTSHYIPSVLRVYLNTTWRQEQEPLCWNPLCRCRLLHELQELNWGPGV